MTSILAVGDDAKRQGRVAEVKTVFVDNEALVSKSRPGDYRAVEFAVRSTCCTLFMFSVKITWWRV